MGSQLMYDSRVAGPVLRPGDDGYDAERGGFQLAGQHRPDVIVGATSAADIQVAVELAAAAGTPVAVQATGHGVGHHVDGGLLISTRRMSGVRVDAGAGTAWVEAGVRWGAVIEAAAPHGLAPLSGSAPHVSAVGYTLGGGIGLLARRFGYAADHVYRIDLVTADGALRRITADSDPDLFWALRGGRANFGVVTGMLIGLMPLPEFYGGALYFDAGQAGDVLSAWRRWTDTVPDEMTSSVALLTFPDLPGVPEPLRGKHVTHVRIAYAGDAATGERLIGPLRAVGPRLVDTVRAMPYTESGSIHNEPPQPMAYHASHALLHGLDDRAVATLLAEAGPGSADPRIVELRHLGGALAAAPEHPSAVGHRDAAYLLGMVSPLREPDPAPVRAGHERFFAAMADWSTGAHNVNFLYGSNATDEAVRTAYLPDDYERLATIKASHDPDNIFRLNHNIPPARR